MYNQAILYYIGEELVGYLGESSLGIYTFLILSSWTKVELTSDEAKVQVKEQPVKASVSKTSRA